MRRNLLNWCNFVSISKKLSFYMYELVKRGSLLGNEELDLGGDLPFFELEF